MLCIGHSPVRTNVAQIILPHITIHWHSHNSNTGILTIKFCSLLARQHCNSSCNLALRSLEGCGLQSIVKRTEPSGPSNPNCDIALLCCKSDCRVSTGSYSRQEVLNIVSGAKMWNNHITPCCDNSLPSHKNIHTHTFCVCVCAQHHHSQYKSIHHTIRCMFINYMMLHQQSVPSHLHVNPNLTHFIPLSYLNLYQMLTAYSLLTTVNFRYTTWQLKRNLTFNKQTNISLNAQSFCLTGKTLSCSGHLKQTALWP